MRPFVRLATLAALTGAASCAVPAGEQVAFVASEVGFGTRTGERIDGRDVVVGLNLTGNVSTGRDPLNCGRREFVAPDGTPGVNNQFSFLYDQVSSTFQEGTVEGIIKNSINEGRLLLMVQLSNVQDFRNDPEIEVTIFLGEGAPAVGTDNVLVHDQTFDVRADAEIGRSRGSIVDGVIRSEPINLVMPMAFFDVFFDLRLRDARIQAELDQDGRLVGVLGGGVAEEQIYEIGMEADARQGEQITPTLRTLIPLLTDLYPDENGRCSHLSAALTFRGVPAFVFADVQP